MKNFSRLIKPGWRLWFQFSRQLQNFSRHGDKNGLNLESQTMGEPIRFVDFKENMLSVYLLNSKLISWNLLRKGNIYFFQWELASVLNPYFNHFVSSAHVANLINFLDLAFWFYFQFDLGRETNLLFKWDLSFIKSFCKLCMGCQLEATFWDFLSWFPYSSCNQWGWLSPDCYWSLRLVVVIIIGIQKPRRSSA